MVIDKQQLLQLYGYMVASRESDIVEAELVNSGEANFLASSKGHEGSTLLAPFLIKDDWLHCHYRDKSLMLARGISNEMFFYSALAKAESHSAGRQMVSHMSAPELNVMSLVGPVGNNALQAAGVAMSVKHSPSKPFVFCSIGDGTSQQGEVLEAIAEAKRSELPVLFFIHNNNLAISTRTEGKTFFSLPDGSFPRSFYNIPITHIDGTNPLQELNKVESIIDSIREYRTPQIIVMNVYRMDNHSNADDQKLYRTDDEIKLSHGNDPLLNSQAYLLANGFTQEEINKYTKEVITQVRLAVETARHGTNPLMTQSAEVELSADIKPNASEYRGDFNAEQRLTMLEAMRSVFDSQLKNDPNVIILGEDIEDGKGDVFGVTRGLSTTYPGRVLNSALSESTIVGLSVGMALTGKKPVAFIQFADFLPCTYNQIFSELATMYWRTNGGWQTPVMVFAACGAYRPGLGPFHSQTNEGTFAHIPGLDVYMPSNAADAAGMINAAFKSNRPSLFLYPKKLLNNGSIVDTTSIDVDKQLVPVGKARVTRVGEHITLVAWGNTVEMCEKVADELETVGMSAEVIDIRTIKPYDKETIVKSAEKTRNLIVVHEDNLTCGVGGDILATVAEYAKRPVKMRRITRPDTYTPCNFANQLELLPSFEKILIASSEMLGLKLSWEEEGEIDPSVFTVDVIGASPSDETVIINVINVNVGDEVKSGDVLVEIEASKSAGEILSPCNGIIEEICVELDDKAEVGKPLVKIRLPEGILKASQAKPRKPILERKIIEIDESARNVINARVGRVGIARPQFRSGANVVSNDEILKLFPDFTDEDIIQRTGIKQRHRLAEGQSVTELAVEAAIDTLDKQNLKLQDIDLVICATCSPEELQSPSMACLILDKLTHIYGKVSVPAYDLNAACSGYIYALQVAQDYLRTRPHSRVMLITAEALSPRIKADDFETAFLFADAATVTIVTGEDNISECEAELMHVYIGSEAESGDVLNIPTDMSIGIQMQGKKLFSVAVKTMASAIHKCCEQANFNVSNINLAVPHQANQRILSAVESRLKLPSGIMFSNIANYGNTSSCTIPIALNEALAEDKGQLNIALCAFGAGFTTGAALLKLL